MYDNLAEHESFSQAHFVHISLWHNGNRKRNCRLTRMHYCLHTLNTFTTTIYNQNEFSVHSTQFVACRNKTAKYDHCFQLNFNDKLTSITRRSWFWIWKHTNTFLVFHLHFNFHFHFHLNFLINFEMIKNQNKVFWAFTTSEIKFKFNKNATNYWIELMNEVWIISGKKISIENIQKSIIIKCKFPVENPDAIHLWLLHKFYAIQELRAVGNTHALGKSAPSVCWCCIFRVLVKSWCHILLFLFYSPSLPISATA